MVFPMANLICVNCYLDYPVGYCEFDLEKGCKDNEASDGTASNQGFGLFDPSEEPNKDEGLNDPVSTGRKRAAKLYPIAPGQVCEWAWKKHCGGSIEPIVGCTGRPATNIHHGPDKSTLNNDRETNISIICEYCHNRFHTANDKYYIEPRPKDNLIWLPDPLRYADKALYALSDIQEASKQEVLINEMMIPEGGKDARNRSKK